MNWLIVFIALLPQPQQATTHLNSWGDRAAFVQKSQDDYNSALPKVVPMAREVDEFSWSSGPNPSGTHWECPSGMSVYWPKVGLADPPHDPAPMCTGLMENVQLGDGQNGIAPPILDHAYGTPLPDVAISNCLNNECTWLVNRHLFLRKYWTEQDPEGQMPEPVDVPAVPADSFRLKEGDLPKCPKAYTLGYTGYNEAGSWLCVPPQPWKCEDTGRVLLRSEDGKMHCIKF
jgi:hypothetical protein